MSDDATATPPDEAAGPPLGPWLRDARERQNLSVEAVAAALHLDPGIVSALESDRFERLGAPVFVKGHVRALAAHLGLAIDEAVRRYEATAGDAALRPPDLIVQYQRPLRRNRLAPLLAIAALVLIIVLLLMFLMPGGERAAPATGDVSLTSAPETVDEPVPERPAAPAADAADASPSDDFTARLETARARSAAAGGARSPEPEPSVVTTGPAVSAAADVVQRDDAAPGGSGLTLRFSETCWYEVRDASDRRLATGTATAGDVRRVDGQRPFTVVVGVADAVSVSLDGEPVPIPADARRGRSATLTLP